MSDLEQMVADAKLRFKHQEHKVYLKEKYKGKLVIPCNGGLFTITMELLAFLSSQVLVDRLIILDDYSTPIQVVPKDFYKILLDRYNEVMNEWIQETNEVSRLR